MKEKKRKKKKGKKTGNRSLELQSNKEKRS